eukprot:3730213-Amphidinium_carterae.1
MDLRITLTKINGMCGMVAVVMRAVRSWHDFWPGTKNWKTWSRKVLLRRARSSRQGLAHIVVETQPLVFEGGVLSRAAGLHCVAKTEWKLVRSGGRQDVRACSFPISLCDIAAT